MEDLNIISQELVKALFDYDCNSGVFTRRLTTGSKAKVGSLAGVPTESGYIDIIVNGHKYKAHRLAWLYCFGEFPTQQLDHIDNNRSNNSLDNLREASNLENSFNKQISSLNTTGYKGVSIDKRSNRYRAYITINGKQKSLGYYATAAEAGQAYIEAAQALHGEFYNENIS